jgi:nitrite reductase/ring-hydroxylating ferredoxin subunit
LTRLFSLDEIDEDILLIKDRNNKFYAIESRCSHEGFEAIDLFILNTYFEKYIKNIEI